MPDSPFPLRAMQRAWGGPSPCWVLSGAGLRALVSLAPQIKDRVPRLSIIRSGAAPVSNGLKLSEELCRFPGILSEKRAAKVSVRAFCDELGQRSGTVVVGAVGRLGKGTGILAHGVAGDPELVGDLPQGEALDPGVLHPFPECQLPRGQLPARRKGSFSAATGRLDRTVVDRLRLQVGQLSQLGLAETMVAQAFDDAAEFRGGSHGPVGGSQHTGSRRSLAAGDDFALIAYLEVSVSVFQDFHLDSGIAGAFAAGSRCRVRHWNLTVLSLATWRVCLKQRTRSRKMDESRER